MNSSMVLRSPQLAVGGDVRVVRLFGVAPPTPFAKGGLAKAAAMTRAAGRGDDDVLLHITQEEFDALKSNWGEPEINPNTGLPEYGFLSKVWKKVKGVVKKIAPYAGIIASVFFPALAPALGGMLGASGAAAGAIGNAAIGAASGAATGGGKGALAGALTGGLGGSGGKIGAALGAKGTTAKLLGDALVSGAANKIQGGDFAEGALKGGALSAAMPSIQKAGTNIKNALGDSSVGQAIGMKGTPPLAQAAYNEGLSPGEMGPPPPQMGPPSPGTPVPSAGAPAAASGDLDLMGLAKKYWPVALLAGSMGSRKSQQPSAPPELPSEWTAHLPQLQFNREGSMPQQDWYTYGMRPERSFYTDNSIPTFTPGEDQDKQGMSHGGALTRASQFIRGPGSGRSDSIPAQLSDGEYVLTAEDVALIGDGSSDAGARRLDDWRRELRRHKGRKLAKGEISAKAKKPSAYLKGNRRG